MDFKSTRILSYEFPFSLRRLQYRVRDIIIVIQGRLEKPLSLKRKCYIGARKIYLRLYVKDLWQRSAETRVTPRACGAVMASGFLHHTILARYENFKYSHAKYTFPKNNNDCSGCAPIYVRSIIIVGWLFYSKAIRKSAENCHGGKAVGDGCREI